jgi:hypothetical protein
MSSRENGTPPEIRFFRATSRFKQDTPLWLLKIERTHPLMDVKAGADALAYVYYPFCLGAVVIPIQIKGSETGAEKHWEKHPWALQVGVVMIVIKQAQKDDEIRKALYSKLAHARIRRLRFEGILKERMDRKLNDRGWEYVRKVEEDRLRNPLRYNLYSRPPLELSKRLLARIF